MTYGGQGASTREVVLILHGQEMGFELNDGRLVFRPTRFHLDNQGGVRCGSYCYLLDLRCFSSAPSLYPRPTPVRGAVVWTKLLSVVFVCRSANGLLSSGDGLLPRRRMSRRRFRSRLKRPTITPRPATSIRITGATGTDTVDGAAGGGREGCATVAGTLRVPWAAARPRTNCK